MKTFFSKFNFIILIKSDFTVTIKKLHHLKYKCLIQPFFSEKFNKLPLNNKKLIRYFSTTSFNNATNLSLVVWGTNLTSQVGSARFTKQITEMIALPPYQKSVVVGLILSDGMLRYAAKRSKNVLLLFGQSLAHSSYVWFVFFILSHYCKSLPVCRPRKRGENIFWIVEFATRSLPCLNEFYSLFYVNGIKVIPDNIYDLLSPVALAHVIMGDGSIQRHGLILCTDSYSVQDVVRIMNVLIIRYRLKCTLRYHRSTQSRIYISEQSMPLLRQIVKPYMCSSMLYKIKL